jgi:glycosyltransferase involved in cell wall biosynthesis
LKSVSRLICYRKTLIEGQLMANPFISIISAALNSGSTIELCLESIRRQSFVNFEHIIFDGGSTDNTLDILKCYDCQYPLRWVSEPDRGIAHALNKGGALARGMYILALHADDRLVDGTALDRVYHLIQDEYYDICSFQVIRERPCASPFTYRPIRIPGWYHFKHTIPHQGAFVHRRLFDQIGGFSEKFAITMDYDFFYRAFKARASICYFHMPVSRMGGYGVSSQKGWLLKRLKEEQRVQDLNEKSFFWRAAQLAFRSFYNPYKIQKLKL